MAIDSNGTWILQGTSTMKMVPICYDWQVQIIVQSLITRGSSEAKMMTFHNNKYIK